jgi:hypothetical protein
MAQNAWSGALVRFRGARISPMAEDEFDSPFAHVPAAGAGPIPTQEGPFTWEKVAASTAKTGYASRSPRWAIVAICLLGALIVAAAIATWVAAAT